MSSPSSSEAAPNPSAPKSSASCGCGRLWFAAVASIVVGALLGLAWTIGELGMRPSGDAKMGLGMAAQEAPPPPEKPKGPPPKAVAPQTAFDFGKQDKESSGRHDFVVRNAGKGELELSVGQTSCSCTVEEIANPLVHPGGSTNVTVKWQPRVRALFSQSAEVLTNDPAQPKLTFYVTGDVTSSFRVDPEGGLTFTELTATASDSADVRIFSYMTDSVTPKDLELVSHDTSPFFELSVEKMPAAELKREAGAKSGCLLIVRLKPGLPAGRFEQTIRFKLDVPGHPQIEVPVHGQVVAPVEVVGSEPEWKKDPGVVDLGTIVSREGKKSRNLYLYVHGDAQQRVKLSLGKMIPDSAALKVTIGKLERMTPGVSRAELTIEIPPGSPSANHLGDAVGKLAQVFIDTGLEEAKQLRVLVRYAVREE